MVSNVSGVSYATLTLPRREVVFNIVKDSKSNQDVINDSTLGLANGLTVINLVAFLVITDENCTICLDVKDARTGIALPQVHIVVPMPR